MYDSEKSEAAKKDILSGVSWAKGFVMNGQKIIDRGEVNRPAYIRYLEITPKRMGQTRRNYYRKTSDFIRTDSVCIYSYRMLHDLSGTVPPRLLPKER